jgi:hypothetical protein
MHNIGEKVYDRAKTTLSSRKITQGREKL